MGSGGAGKEGGAQASGSGIAVLLHGGRSTGLLADVSIDREAV